MAVLHHHAAGRGRAGHGLFRLGRGGAGALSLALRVCRQAGSLGAGRRGWPCWSSCTLTTAATIRRKFIYRRVVRHHAAAGAGLLLSRLAQHPSLDPLWRSFSPFSPLRSPSPCWCCFWPGFCTPAWTQCSDWKHTLAARHPHAAGFYPADCLPTRSGNGAGPGRRHRHDAVSGRTGVEVPGWSAFAWRCPLRGGSAHLGSLAIAAHPGLPQSKLRCKGCRRAPATISANRLSPLAPAALPASATWRACRSSFTCPKPQLISSSPTSPKSWA